MQKLVSLSGALALALLYPVAAHAATDQELDEIRVQIRDLKAVYEARIQALEQRLKDAEAKAASAPPPAPIAAPAQAGTRSSGLAAFNPAISAILAGSYNNLSQDPANYRLHGFVTPPDIGPQKRGFSLGESELTFSANVDPKFSGTLTFSLSPDNSVEVEEAYGIFNGAPYGIVPKLGRFLSAVGYLNEQHAHAWDFADAPLAYQAFLGGQYRNDGVQLRWIAPTEHYVELGAEAGAGDSFPGAAKGGNGIGSATAFARTGGDIGESHSWLAGVSYMHLRHDGRADFVDAPIVGEAPFDNGATHLTGAQFVWKYAPNGNPLRTNFKLQSEYFWRPGQRGGYVQGVYQFMPTWRAGLRYDRLDPGSVEGSFKPERSSAMIDWSPSEFSRVRLQLARAKLAPDFADNEVFLQYILSIGAHGAHKY